MVMRKDYSMDEYKKFLSQPTAYNFGISKDKMAGYFVTHADRLVNRFGLTKAYVKNKIIPRIESNLGSGSYVIFLTKAIIEGGTQGNFLNHYMRGAPQDKANPLLAVDEDCKVIKTHWNKDSGAPISMQDPLTGVQKPFETGNPREFYNSLPKKSIGSHYMVMTAAGNWWIFAPNSTANSPANYYGNAYDDSINIIKHLGGDPFKKGKNNNSSGGKDTPSSDDSISGILKDLGREGQKVLEALFNEIEKMLTYDLHSIGTDMFFSNEYFKLFKTYNNTYRIQINIPFFDTLEKKVGSLDFGSNGSKGSKGKDDKDDKDDSKPSSNKTMEKIYQYLKKNVGNKFDADGAYGAQCVDLVHHVSNHFGLGLNTAGDYAKNIASNPVPSGWKHVNVPNGASKAQRTKIWNDLPRGAVVYFWNAGAGHVGFKSGDNFKLLSQNMKNDALMGGGNITNENVSNFESGNHFFKAWVKAS